MILYNKMESQKSETEGQLVNAQLYWYHNSKDERRILWGYYNSGIMLEKFKWLDVFIHLTSDN